MKAKSKQKEIREHGGTLSINKRRSRRPLHAKDPQHVVLRSYLARGDRLLTREISLVNRIITKFSKRFRVRIFEKAICVDHIHLLIKGKTRKEIQNFFRCVAGHIAQEILKLYPLTKIELAQKTKLGCKKNRRTFWASLIYTRIVNWGLDFKNVSFYVVQNTLESMGLVSYKFRNKSGANKNERPRTRKKSGLARLRLPIIRMS